jgi:GNAT superfamily N-acetyltransferase
VIEEVPRDSESAAREFTMVAMSGFLAAGQSPSEEDFAIMSRQINHPRSISLVARRGGVAVAACGMEMSSGVAALFGLSVLPEQRRQGIQQALLAWRLNYASKNGARVATIGSRPGVATERNVRRMGFEVAYTKVVVALYGPGLVPVRFT